MAYVNVEYTTYLQETLALLKDPGLLLVVAGAEAKHNAMTIGWGTVGIIWGKPIFTVLVRPSRHTYQLIEEADSFTVCVPAESHFNAVDFCGTRSGRDHDKFLECDLKPLASTSVRSPGIDGCPVIYECKIVHYNDVEPASLGREQRANCYPAGDFHRIYFGEIVAVRALPNAQELL